MTLYEVILTSDPELVEAFAGLVPEELIDVSGVEVLARFFAIMVNRWAPRPGLLHSLYRGIVTIVVAHEPHVVKEILEDLARVTAELGRPPEPFYAARYAGLYDGVCCRRETDGGYAVALGYCPEGFERVEC